MDNNINNNINICITIEMASHPLLTTTSAVVVDVDTISILYYKGVAAEFPMQNCELLPKQ